MTSSAAELSSRAHGAWILCLALAVTSTNGQSDAINITCPLLPCVYTNDLFNSTFGCPYSGCDQIPAGIPDDVVFVDLRGNSIKSVDNTLHGYDRLDTLDLSCNVIDSIADKALPADLINLNLSNNVITMEVLAGKAFDDVNALEYLNLANNRIENLTISNIFWFKMPNLRRLDMSGNQIRSIAHNALTDLRMLESVDLSRNQIRNLEAEDFMGLGSLHHLNLSDNQVEAIPERFFHGLDAIRTLDLSDNLILELSNLSIVEGDALETLHLERNKLRRIPSAMSSYLTRLQFLYLDGNPLEIIEHKAFPFSLNGISIQKCDALKEIGEVFGGETNNQLKTVMVRENHKLQAIHGWAFGGRNASVKELDLSYNALTTLPESLVNWGNLTSANLAGNYWDCDCSMAWVERVRQSTPVLESLVCYNPMHLRGSKAVDLDASQFSCSVASKYRRQGALLLAIVFTCVVFASLALVARRYRHRLCPAMYPAGKYETLYSSAEAAADDELSFPVTIKKRDAIGGGDDEPVAV